VTHDQTEAVTLGDRVCVLRDGVLQQADRPQVLYDRPANLFVAGFIGSPAMNFVEADLVDANGRVSAQFGDQMLVVPPAVLAARPALRTAVGRRVVLGVRPEDIGHVEPADGSSVEVTVDIREDMGAEIFLHFSIHATLDTTALRRIAGEEAAEAAEAQHAHADTWVARAPRGIGVREGDWTQLGVDTKLLHFFDLETGTALLE
jgi:multiple sugar transport system ATP-binding protein